jgi:hypothetical protein
MNPDKWALNEPAWPIIYAGSAVFRGVWGGGTRVTLLVPKKRSWYLHTWGSFFSCWAAKQAMLKSCLTANPAECVDVVDKESERGARYEARKKEPRHRARARETPVVGKKKRILCALRMMKSARVQ